MIYKQHIIRQLLNGECCSDFGKVKYLLDGGWPIDLDDMVRISV